MPSLDFARIRHELKRDVIGQVADDTPVLFKLKYIGGGTVTSVTVTGATDITMVSVAGGITYTDAYHWATPATYTTVQLMTDAINKDGRFEARTMDALNATVLGATTVLNSGALTVDAVGEYNVLSDTSGAKYLAYRLTYDRTFGNSRAIRNGHRVSIREIVTSLTLGGGADANGLKIYECTPPGNNAPYGDAEILVLQRTPTTGSAETITWASGKGKITANEGNDLVVIITDAGSITGSITVNGELE
jgi:hypothetical protein